VEFSSFRATKSEEPKETVKRIVLYYIIIATCLASSRGVELQADDKSSHTLFNPTPSESLRVWRTDHAGIVPYTIDAGHFEADITGVTYGYDEQEFGGFVKIRTESWSYGITQIKLGLLDRLDAEVIIRPYQTITSTLKANDFPVFRETGSGFGDVVSRLKLNVWGNDSGKTALSISGDVKFPTAEHGIGELGNGQFEGGPGLEFAAQLPWEFELRINSAINFFEDASDSRQAAFANLMSLSHGIVPNLEGYCAFSTSVSTITGEDWIGSVKIGLNYRIAKKVELYVGNSFGVTDDAFDYAPFVGVAARF
jgi:hypothetical protein